MIDDNSVPLQQQHYNFWKRGAEGIDGQAGYSDVAKKFPEEVPIECPVPLSRLVRPPTFFGSGILAQPTMTGLKRSNRQPALAIATPDEISTVRSTKERRILPPFSIQMKQDKELYEQLLDGSRGTLTSEQRFNFLERGGCI